MNIFRDLMVGLKELVSRNVREAIKHGVVSQFEFAECSVADYVRSLEDFALLAN
jgi:hypothetical protein